MIISRPKPNALFALSVFIVFALSLAYAGIKGPIDSGIWHWYNYIAVWFFGPLAMILSFRIMYNFKVIYIGKGHFIFWFPFRFFRKKYKLEELISWSVDSVKTGKTVFKQLEMKFSNKSFKISNQENTSYDNIYKYLSQKSKSKRND